MTAQRSSVNFYFCPVVQSIFINLYLFLLVIMNVYLYTSEIDIN